MRGRNRAAWVAASLFGAVAVACSFTTETDDLAGSTGGQDASSESPIEMGSESDVAIGAIDSASDAGAPDVATGCVGEAGPKQVRIDTDAGFFCVDSTEVTREQYDQFLMAKPNITHPRCGFKKSHVPDNGWPYDAVTKDFPVTGLDWCDAYAYCAWAGKRLCGKLYGGAIETDFANRVFQSELPYVCSAAGTLKYPYGNAFDPNACATAAGDGGVKQFAVGTAPNCEGGYPGIFDLAGNVSEWFDSCYVPDGGDAGNDSCRAFNSPYWETEPKDLDCTTVRAQPRGSRAEETGIRCCSP